MLEHEILCRSVVSADPDGVLRKHFTLWCARFKIFPTESGFATETGHVVYPAHGVIEADGTVWLSTLASFDQSGIRGHVENHPGFRDMLAHASKTPDRAPDGIALLIGRIPYQVIFQNTTEAGADHIINVAFINRKSLYRNDSEA
ncbi:MULTISPECIES: hypothetical protein [Micrococcaceae]|uniref:Uncharacterized protein n=1 Tax=Paenarthrobacter aromaticivorans TaxID=2849150 RepID=A0ABS6I7E1_9MICC|nr:MULTISPECIES: hypothetical protein [Micrococcaceae]MBU8867628.1 hypothetical protein [Paenarthrobacter sp. MMS21-TAE1-1]BCW06435.1 hypothetical protein NtRootA1_25730 [Arthrobacter sp. NtRootA1]